MAERDWEEKITNLFKKEKMRKIKLPKLPNPKKEIRLPKIGHSRPKHPSVSFGKKKDKRLLKKD